MRQYETHGLPEYSPTSTRIQTDQRPNCPRVRLSCGRGHSRTAATAPPQTRCPRRGPPPESEVSRQVWRNIPPPPKQCPAAYTVSPVKGVFKVLCAPVFGSASCDFPTRVCGFASSGLFIQNTAFYSIHGTVCRCLNPPLHDFFRIHVPLPLGAIPIGSPRRAPAPPTPPSARRSTTCGPSSPRPPVPPPPPGGAGCPPTPAPVGPTATPLPQPKSHRAVLVLARHPTFNHQDGALVCR